MMRTIKIAVTQSSCGHLTCVGPNDFKESDFNNAMDAAFSWSIEAGYMPTSRYWVEAAIPEPLEDAPTISATLQQPGTRHGE